MSRSRAYASRSGGGRDLFSQPPRTDALAGEIDDEILMLTEAFVPSAFASQLADRLAERGLLPRFERLAALLAANGQAGTEDLRESHSNFGQSQVEAGIAIDMSTMDSIASVDRHHAEVEAGVHWSDVFDLAAAHGATPPVLTDYMHLSIGGTLSVGAIGGTSQRFGVQADNVLELEVVTGRGERLRCSRDAHRDLFEAVLAGAGQCAIIVRARVRLVRAESHARVFLRMFRD